MGQNVDLRVLRAEEFAPFQQRNIARYAQELLFARATDTEEHALTEAQGALDEMLPQGVDTPRNYLLAAESGGETVGELWCDTTEPERLFRLSRLPRARLGQGDAARRGGAGGGAVV